MKNKEVFIPNGVPTVTYVERNDHKVEEEFRRIYGTPNMIVSISGPSKTGKTVLVKKIAGEENLILAHGPSLVSAEELWNKVLDFTGAPLTTTAARGTSMQMTGTAEVGGSAGIPLVAKGTLKGAASLNHGSTNSDAAVYSRGGLEQVVKDISGTDYTVFIDDYHYIPKDAAEEIGRHIKTAAERGVKIIAASVPYKSDDIVNSNPELRGRVVSLEIRQWSELDLGKIANQGFAALNVDLSPIVVRRLSKEAFGSPQLMQMICYNLADIIGAESKLEKHERIDVTDDQIKEAFLATSKTANFRKLVNALHTGPRVRGTERKEFDLTDGSKGDAYRVLLLAIQQEPAQTSFTYDDITTRVRNVCNGDAPMGSSISTSLNQMDAIAKEQAGNSSPLVWDGNVLEIVDPYFQFYVRCSDALSDLR